MYEGETSDGLKVQSHVSIGANDLLIVGPGVLGRLVAEKWREVHFLCYFSLLHHCFGLEFGSCTNGVSCSNK